MEKMKEMKKLASKLIELLENETLRWKHAWLKDITLLCLRYLTISPTDTMRETLIPGEIIKIAAKAAEESSDEEPVRVCTVCGKPLKSGMTDDDGSFYCHEECFNEYMNKTYGEGKWMAIGGSETDGCGGYYITTADVPGGFEGTGIYYTEWED